LTFKDLAKLVQSQTEAEQISNIANLQAKLQGKISGILTNPNMKQKAELLMISVALTTIWTFLKRIEYKNRYLIMKDYRMLLFSVRH
jgi:hypothetical protein